MAIATFLIYFLGLHESQARNLENGTLTVSVQQPVCQLAQFGGDGVKQLWEPVSRELMGWLRSRHFGSHELDCLLIHGVQ